MRGLVLVPTKELARQAQAMIQQLAAYCARDIRVANVSAAEDSASQRCAEARAGGGGAAQRGGWVRPRMAFSLTPRGGPPAELC